MYRKIFAPKTKVSLSYIIAITNKAMGEFVIIIETKI